MSNEVQRVIRRRALRTVLVALALAGVQVAGPPVPAEAAAARSGTIISGLLTTAPAWGCGLQPECLPWLQSGCSPLLAGRDPAWMSAIVDVADLADGSTPRTIAIRRGAGDGVILGGAYVQFWRRDCTEVTSASWHSFWDCSSSPNPYRAAARPPCFTRRGDDSVWRRLEAVWTTFALPREVAWMTVSANDNINITWSIS